MALSKVYFSSVPVTNNNFLLLFIATPHLPTRNLQRSSTSAAHASKALSSRYLPASSTSVGLQHGLVAPLRRLPQTHKDFLGATPMARPLVVARRRMDLISQTRH